VTLPSGAEADKASGILTDMMAADELVLRVPPPLVFVESQSGASTVVLNCSFRVPPEKVGEVQRTIVGEAERQLEAAGISAMVPQQIVRTVPSDTDPSRLLTSRNEHSVLTLNGV